MYRALKIEETKVNYNSLLIRSILLLGLGAPILGGIALYNTLKLHSALLLYASDYDADIKSEINQRQKRISRLISIGVFIIAVKIFFIAMLIWGAVDSVNEYLYQINTVGGI